VKLMFDLTNISSINTSSIAMLSGRCARIADTLGMYLASYGIEPRTP
jgi:hypothetical protein